jgi:F-type H+-transporting ATPase subunit a
MLKLFATFAAQLIGAALSGAVFMGVVGLLAFGMGVALNALELLVAGLQAYVFAILTCVYLNDALHPSH